MRKQYLINLNPDENPDIGYLNLGLLANPFEPSCLKNPVPEIVPSPMQARASYERLVEKHLNAGCSPEQARQLLHGLLSGEVIGLILKDANAGDRLDVIVDSDAMQLYKRKIPKQDKAINQS